MTKSQMERRGERLKRLAYELELLNADAKADGIGDWGRHVAGSVSAIADGYFEKAAGREP